MSSSAIALPQTTERGRLGVLRQVSPRKALRSALVLAIVLAVWEGAVRWFDLPPYFIPAPSRIVAALASDLSTPLFYTHIWTTFEAVMAGFVIGSLTGLVIGGLIAQFRTVEEIVYPYVVALQTLPKVAVAPLLIVWVGFGLESKILVAAMIALFPVLVNTVTGLKSVEQDKLDLMTALAATRWQTFRMVSLPSALPVIFAGLEIALVFAIIGAIVGEFVGAKAGLGYLIQFRNFQLDVPGIFSALVVLSVMGVVLNWAIKALGRKLIFWQRVDQNTGI